MTTKQYIQNKDNKLGLFNWAWATYDTETYRVYNALLDDFLAKPDVSSLKFKKKVLFFWHLYTGSLQDFVLNGKQDDEIMKHCPLSKRELNTLFK